jgi:hypothetical protein
VSVEHAASGTWSPDPQHTGAGNLVCNLATLDAVSLRRDTVCLYPATLDTGWRILCSYQGVNWQDKSQWHCNSDESPYKESHYDGINVDPLEVLFVKVGRGHRQRGSRCCLPAA